MTRLAYLLPFLWALALGTTVTNKPTTVATPPLTTANQVATTVDMVKTTVNPTNPAVLTSAASTKAAVSSLIPKLPSVSAGTTKPTATVSSGPQDAVLTATVKTDTKAAAVTTSSESRLSTVNVNTPNVTSPEDKTTQPTNLAEAAATVLNNSSVAVTSQPNFTENGENLASKLAATSFPFSGTSEQSKGIGVTNNDTKVAISSTEAPSPVTKHSMPTTAAGRISDFTTSLQKETIPITIPTVNSNQENIEVNCTAEHEGSFVKINIKPSRICGEYAKYEDDAKEIFKHICTALKPGYQPNKDKCHIDLGNGIAGQLVVVNAYVQSSLSPDELYASLKDIKKGSSYLFQYDKGKYEEEDVVSIPLISAIVSLAVALLIIAAIYGCWHQRQTRKREQRLTEELQTMENGYHDNPTLEVMETSPEMQEKKGGPNGELGDSWIVPLDNLTREDFDEEEDTHL